MQFYFYEPEPQLFIELFFFSEKQIYRKDPLLSINVRRNQKRI